MAKKGRTGFNSEVIKLGIDLRHVPMDGSPGAGVSHASRELTGELVKHGPEFGIEVIPIRGQMRSWSLAGVVRREKLDALFCASGAVPPFTRVPTFPWVHDVAIFKHPEWFPQSIVKRFFTKAMFLRGVRRAKHVFTVSEDTKRSLMDVAQIKPERITVTYQGVFTHHMARITPPLREHRYAIMVGTIEPRKNIPFIFNLWDEVRRRSGDVKLIIAGNRGWGKVFSRNTRLAEPHVEWVFDPSDADRDALIAAASVLLLPSLYEGFGRSALEAMALGIPVIASRRGAIPEIVGNAGILLDPTDREAWIANITRGFVGELDGSLGPGRAAQFSWEQTARIILAKVKEIG